jgi:hypothetical protein
MTRTDIHRPAVIRPDEYQFVSMEFIKIGAGGDVLADCGYLNACRERIAAHMKMTGGTYAGHEHGGNCMVCGASAIYTALFYHAATNSYVRTGQDCAEKLGLGADWDAFRKAVTNAREAHAGKRKAILTLEDAGLSRCWDIYTNPPRFDQPAVVGDPGDPGYDEAASDAYWAALRAFERAHNQERIIADIVGKLIKYGSISPAQIGFLGKLLAQIDERPAREAKRAAEAEAAAPCPAGRLALEGVVLSVRVDEDGPYGPTTKILLKHDTGFKVWGSLPSGTHAEQGHRIAFRATVKASDKDPKFGFFSRPSNGRNITREQEAI